MHDPRRALLLEEIVKIRVLAVTAIAALTLTACGSGQQLSGAAAVVGDVRIPQSAVTDQVSKARADIEKLPKDAVQQVPTLVLLGAMNVDRLVLDEILKTALSKKTVTVTPVEISTFRDSIYAQYGKDAVQQQLLTQNGVPIESVDDFMYEILAQQKLMAVLAPSGDQNAQVDALNKYMAQTSNDVGVQLSPRYGEWNPNKMMSAAGDITLSVQAPK